MNLKFLGFSNIQVKDQFGISYTSADNSDDGARHIGVVAGLINANKSIALYHGDTLVADGIMPSTPLSVDGMVIKTVGFAELELRDTSFSGFVESESYTVNLGNSEPTGVYCVNSTTVASWNVSDFWVINENVDGVAFAMSRIAELASALFSISRKKLVTKKMYDTKLLPEDLLPKSVAKKSDVATVKAIANEAKFAADNAKTAADKINDFVDVATKKYKKVSWISPCSSGAELRRSSNADGSSSVVIGYKVCDLPEWNLSREFPSKCIKEYSRVNNIMGYSMMSTIKGWSDVGEYGTGNYYVEFAQKGVATYVLFIMRTVNTYLDYIDSIYNRRWYISAAEPGIYYCNVSTETLDDPVTNSFYIETNCLTSNAVEYSEQILTDSQKMQARDNIGAGTSNFSGSYHDLSDKIGDIVTVKEKILGSSAFTYAESSVEGSKVSFRTAASVPDYGTEEQIVFDGSGVPPQPVVSVKRAVKIYEGQYRYYSYIGNLSLVAAGNAVIGWSDYFPESGDDTGEDYLLIKSEVISLTGVVTRGSLREYGWTLYKVTTNVTPISDALIPGTIQRVGDDVIISSSTPSSTKQLKVTVDDAGTPTIASTDSGDSTKWTPYTPPTVTTADAGKVLRVSSDGAWVAEAIECSSIPKIESLDTANIKTFRSIEDGIYVLDGYFTPYTGSDSTFIFDPPALTSISSTATETHVQIFEAYDNRIQHLIVTDTSCEKTEVLLNDITKAASEIGDLTTLKTTAKDTLVNAINETASAIPAVTSSDNGKFLQVVDGAWTAATISNVNGVSF